MPHRIRSTFLCFAVFLALAACGLLNPASAPTPTRMPTHTAAATSTLLPTAPTTQITPPTHTLTPEPLPTQVCDPDEVLKQLRTVVTYDQFALHYNSLDGAPSLVVWYVESWIESPSPEDSVMDQTLTVQNLALQMISKLNYANGCVGELFDTIKPIVVDRYYNGWFAGAVEPSSLPDMPDPSEDDLKPALENLDITYQRQDPPSFTGGLTAPNGMCTWPEAQERVGRHFSEALQNISFYLVIDDVGVNVWAHWIGYGELVETEIPQILNVSMELQCLYPSLDWLWVIVVYDSGDPKLVGRIPGEAVYNDDYMNEVIDQFEKIYP